MREAVDETKFRKERTVELFETSGGGRIYRMPLEAFPGFRVHSFLVLKDDLRVLIDTGSNFENSNQHLEEGLSQTREGVGLEDLTHVLITHGHIDHFGGLAYVQPRTKAQVGVHELERRVLANYEERLTVVGMRLKEFLLESGVSVERTEQLYEMYMLPKALFRSVEIDFTYEQIGMKLGPFEFLHAPGHSPGMVVIRLDDVLFSGDHVLAGISPHQAPESLTLNTGLGHYLDSLEKARRWAKGARLTLGGHNEAIADLPKRIDEIKSGHEERLRKVLGLLGEPRTVADVSKELFGKTEGYNVLLALEEAGAHVEYLYQRGLLEIENLEEVSRNSRSVPIRYRRLETVEPEILLAA